MVMSWFTRLSGEAEIPLSVPVATWVGVPSCCDEGHRVGHRDGVLEAEVRELDRHAELPG